MDNLKITPAPDGVKIQLIGVGPEKAALLKTFNDCAAGSCGCSSDEYEKVASMAVESDDEGITVNVRTKDGETIDPSCITECLDEAGAAAQN